MSSEECSPALVPILVRTFGRTGSTLLMQILGTSERVCFERSYPFEQRYLTYAYDLARMVALPGQHDAQWNNEVMFQGRSPVVGCLPYANVGCLDRAELSHALFRSNWDQFSIAMRKKASLPMEALAYYAEKAPSHVADLANEMFKGKNIFLLRDPRDELVSIKSFNRKRGFNSFGWVDTDTDMSFATKMCKVRGRFMRHLLEMKPDHRRIMVRYEDLIENQQAEVDRLSAWLDLTLDYTKATGDKAIHAKHMTSPGPKASVERWPTELDDDVQGLFRSELGSELAELGYRV